MSPLRFLPKNGSRVYYHYIFKRQNRWLKGGAISSQSKKLIVEIHTGQACRIIHYTMNGPHLHCTRAKRIKN